MIDILQHSSTFKEKEEAKSPPAAPTPELVKEPEKAEKGAERSQSSIEHKKSVKLAPPPSVPPKDYPTLKAEFDPEACLKEMFGCEEYKTDIAESLLVKSQTSMQTMKYKIEAFTPSVRAKYAKDMKQYGGKSVLKRRRQENAVRISQQHANDGVGLRHRECGRGPPPQERH